MNSSLNKQFACQRCKLGWARNSSRQLVFEHEYCPNTKCVDVLEPRVPHLPWLFATKPPRHYSCKRQVRAAYSSHPCGSKYLTFLTLSVFRYTMAPRFQGTQEDKYSQSKCVFVDGHDHHGKSMQTSSQQNCAPITIHDGLWIKCLRSCKNLPAEQPTTQGKVVRNCVVFYSYDTGYRSNNNGRQSRRSPHNLTTTVNRAPVFCRASNA